MDDDATPDQRRDSLKKDLSSISPQHLQLSKRLEKTLYYGRLPSTDRPSLPMTEIAVQFYRDRAPQGFGSIDIPYASFVARRACISPCSMVLGMIYMDRITKRNFEYVQSTSSADVFLISMMMASKFLYDCGSEDEVFNDEWAQSAQMELEDLNRLERTFLRVIDWDLFVTPEQFMDMLNKIERKIALKQATERGWFSYSDLCVLTEDFQPHRQIYIACVELIQMLIVVVSAYVVSLMTMIGSTVLVTSVQSHLYLIQELFVKTQHQAALTSVSVSVQPEIVPQYHLQRPQSHHVVDMETLLAEAQKNPVLETIADQSAARIQERILASSLPNGVPILSSVRNLGTIGRVCKQTEMDLVCSDGLCDETQRGCLNMTSLRCRPFRRCGQCTDAESQCCCRVRNWPDMNSKFDRVLDGIRTSSIIRT